ncbi:hypothetical protein CANARDRAFT_21491 [[Candida] arabinofermentans NRRL YB-2248]|uniref:Nuclear protein localization protein 4 n=1 Tax=[Candida] arabinofermentans NRRL YB-2248 TaxID=983967 RepID=A0A1E4T712_9ASCO|nr:hypothetical protein CANARDRAFT_21491 [[Candida] arabinofermentans NRRL YB-2248]
MIIRIRTKSGMFRLDVLPTTSFGDVVNQLIPKLPPFKLESLSISNQPNTIGQNALSISDQTIESSNLKNGDMLYLTYEESKEPIQDTVISSSISGKHSEKSATVAIDISSSSNNQQKKPNQLAIDDILDKEEGLITRKKTSFCRHTEKGMCEYCSPLPPWDKNYQADHNIKHISFHAYINELNSSTNKMESGSSYISPLSESNYKINKNCPGGHDPWPKGICSKCQPSAITMQRQNFRMVDHIEIQDSEMINNFINSWRLSGTQRIGLMFGTYDKYDKVPLGLKGKVEAIYEFPQLDQEDGLILQEWEDENKILEMANELGLLPIGIIFTDLADAGNGDGTVICKRHKDSFFLSSLELVFAVKWQLKFPNICKWSDSNQFSSKFVTCIISGNTKGEIDIEAYQISECGESLLKADLISPSTHPNEVYINPQNDERYVPEIFYQKINEYGLTIKQNAKPSFPVEYLLVSLTHGFPEKSSPFFKAPNDKKFPIENRGYIGESQDISNINTYLKDAMKSNNVELLAQSLSNFHLLIYLFYGLQILGKEDAKIIASIVRKLGENDESYKQSAYELMNSPGWQTLQTILEVNY